MHELLPSNNSPREDEPGALIPQPASGRVSPLPSPQQFVYGPAEAQTASGGLLDYLELARKHKVVLALAAAIGLAGGIIVSRMQDTVYRARTSIEVFQKTGTEAPTDVMPTEAFIRTQVKILESHSLVEGAAKRLGLAGRRIEPDNPGWLTAIRQAAGRTQAPPATLEDAGRVLAAGLKVRSPDETRLVEITYDSPNRKFTAEVLEAVVAEYAANTAGTREHLTEETSAWLSKQLSEMRRRLQESESALHAYAETNSLVVLGEKDSVAEESLRQLQTELARAEAEKIIKRSQYDLAASRPPASLPEVLDNGPVREFQVKLADLKRDFAEVSLAYLPKHYRYRRLQAQIEAMEKAIERERTNIVKRIENESEAADRRYRALAARYAQQVATVGNQSRHLAQYNLLRREVDTNRLVYESTLQGLRKYGIQSALYANQVRVIDHAKVPRGAFRPRPEWNGTLGLAGGLIVGFGLVLARASGRRTFRTPGEAGLLLGAPELGVIPKVGASRLALMRRQPPALTRWNAGSLLVDPFRATLASILFARRNGARVQVLVVTSALPREGKTTTVTNLAIALAESGRKVLVIDADTRKPHAYAEMGLANDRGLCDLLGSDLDTDPAAYVQHTARAGLDFLPSGPPESGGIQIVYSPRWTALLDHCRARYDTILIDTPPVLHLPDARLLGRMADAVVLVVRANQTDRDQAMLARQRLGEDGIPILGVILNNWEPGTYGYRQGYSAYGYSDAQRSARGGEN